MKVLWFVNNPSNFKKQDGGYNGCGWISSLEEALTENTEDIDLSVAFILKSEKKKIKKGRVTYYPISPTPKGFVSRFVDFFRFDTSFHIEDYSDYLDKMSQIILDVSPDIIHVFGSENIFGLVSQVTNIPIVLHIQGILNPYLNAFLPPFVSWTNYIFFNRSIQTMLKHYRDKYHIKLGANRETFILKHINYYIGRTDWDYRITRLYNQKAEYFYGGEILRQPFYFEAERNIPKQLKIVTTISAPQYKGLDLVLKTVNILSLRENLNFSWNIYGNIDKKLALTKVTAGHINLKGVADAQTLKKDILSSTVYVHPSYIDNSPNSVCEAQILGCTVIATDVGGVSSLIRDKETGFLIPANDPFQLAFLILHLYEDKQLNINIGNKAKEVAQKRHNKNDIIDSLKNTYKNILMK